jgi:hypothetical protein
VELWEEAVLGGWRGAMQSALMFFATLTVFSMFMVYLINGDAQLAKDSRNRV